MPVKITELTASTTITGNDFIQIIDSDDISMSPTGTNKKITASNAANQLANLISSVPPIVVSSLATKANLNSPTFTGNVVLPDTTSIGSVNSAEIGRLSGVTSSIQVQLDGKAPKASPTFTGTITGSLNGNATTATTLQTPRTIALNGDIAGTATSFNGSANITISTAIGTGVVTPSKLSTGAPSWNVGGTLSATAFSGPLTGAVTGNVTGNLTGIASGNIKQGGGTSQLNNVVYVGWSSTSKLRVQVDVTDFGSTWPIDISGNSASATIASSVNDASVSAHKLSGEQTGTAPVYGIRAWAKLNPYVDTNRTTVYKTGTYVANNGSTVTVTMNDHGLKANDRIRLVFTRTGGTGTVPSSATYFDVVNRVSADVFTVSFTSTGSSGTVQAQFVKIQGSGNISSASFYDSGDNRIILNFATPMPDANYCTQVTAQFNAGNWSAVGTEDASNDGNTQFNTMYNCHVVQNYTSRFMNVCVIG